MDQAIVDVSIDDEGATVTVEDRGEIPMPVHVRVIMDSGSWAEVGTEVGIWQNGRAEVRVPHDMEGTVARVVLDADQEFPDVNRADNTWTPGG